MTGMALTKGDPITVVTIAPGTAHAVVIYVPSFDAGGVTADRVVGDGRMSFFLPFAAEGTQWIRGHHDSRSLDVQALLAACALTL